VEWSDGMDRTYCTDDGHSWTDQNNEQFFREGYFGPSFVDKEGWDQEVDGKDDKGATDIEEGF